MKIPKTKDFLLAHGSKHTVTELVKILGIRRDSVNAALKKCGVKPIQVLKKAKKEAKPDLTVNPKGAKGNKRDYSGMRLVKLGVQNIQIYVAKDATKEDVERKKAEWIDHLNRKQRSI